MSNIKKKSPFNVLKKLDILGANYELKYKEHTRFQTRLGGVFTIIAAIAIGISTFAFLRNFFDTTKPNVSVSTKIDNIIPKRNLYDQVFPLGVGMFVNPSTIVQVKDFPKYITPLIFVFELNIEKVDSGIMTFDVVDMISMTACNTIEDKTLVRDFLEAKNEDTRKWISEFFLCADVKNGTNYYVIGNTLQPPYRIVQLGIYPCSLEDTTQCMPEAVLTWSNVGFGMVQNSFLPEDKENPLRRVPLTTDFRIGVEQQMRWDMTLKETQIIDDIYDFSEREVTHSFIDSDYESTYGIKRAIPATHCTMQEILGLTCAAYMTLTLSSSGKTVSIVRTYPKILGTMGEIGGTTEIIFFLVGILYCWYNEHYQHKLKRKRVLNHGFDEYKQVYGIEDKEEEKELDKLADEIVEKRDDIIRLYNNQTNWEVFQQVIFDDYHHVLLPLVLLETEKRKKAKKKLSRTSSAITSFVRAPTQYQSNNKQKMEIAYQKLRKSTPENEIKKALKEYFIESLPDGVKIGGLGFGSMDIDDDKFSDFSEEQVKDVSRKMSAFTENKIEIGSLGDQGRKGSLNITKQKRAKFVPMNSRFKGTNAKMDKIAKKKGILGKGDQRD